MSTKRPDSPSGLVDRFPALRRLDLGGGRGRVPVVRQMTLAECGAACLTMVLGYHGRIVRLDEVRDALGPGRDGMTALGILNGAKFFGLTGRGVRLEVEDMHHLGVGSILHWGFKHFVVLERLKKRGIDIVDPAFGRRHVPWEEVRRSFTGVALILEPGVDFRPGGDVSRPALRFAAEVLRDRGSWVRIVLTSTFVQIFALALPLLTGIVVDRVVPRADEDLLAVLAAGGAALVVFHFLASMARAHVLLHLRTILDARLTLGFVEHLVSLPFSFFQQRSAGDLMMRLNSNSTIREILTAGALSGMLDGFFVLSYLALLLALSPPMGLLAMGLALAQILIFALAVPKQRALMADGLQVQANAQGYQVEMLAGIETLKAAGSEQRAISRFSDLFVDSLNVSLKRGRLAAVVDSALSMLRLVSPLAILGLGALWVLRGQMTLGAMLALSALAAGFLTPVSGLLATGSQLQLLGSYVERLDDVLRTPAEQERKGRSPAPRLSGAVALEHVSFRYGPQMPTVIEDVSLAIDPGSFVAIVGRSGSGKSTLASLLLGLVQPTSGQVLYDGKNLSELDLQGVRRQLGIVLQKPYLFGGTIRTNLALVDPDATLEEMEKAAKLAQIHEDIAAMSMGYDTVLADGGVTLSGGQRQRLALARALVGRPSILLLDEATSSLDAVLERQVQEALASLACTRIVIAHRLSTVVGADVILVMDRGRLIERGTHEQLLAKGGVYAELVAAQLGGAAGA